MMASSAGITPVIIAATQSSSYRVKFERGEFLRLVEIADPKIVYHRGKNHFFASDGFVMYCQQCTSEDFAGRTLIEAIELSNEMWST